MPDPRDAKLQEVTILTRAVENVFRKLIRFLVGRISLVKLQEMISYIYVQESERKLRLESPSKRASLTRLAVLTGFDTRSLVKITNSEDYQQAVHKGERFIKDLTPECSIMEHWTTDQRFTSRTTGKPRKLAIADQENSFEQLFQEVVTSRGVTVASFLDRLEKNGIVKIDRGKNQVSLLEFYYAPFKHGESLRVLEIGLANVVILLDTVFYNYHAIKDEKPKRFQRGSWTHRLSPSRKLEFESCLRNFLEKADEDVRLEMTGFEEPYNSQDQITAGVVMFYFEDVPKDYLDQH